MKHQQVMALTANDMTALKMAVNRPFFEKQIKLLDSIGISLVFT